MTENRRERASVDGGSRGATEPLADLNAFAAQALGGRDREPDDGIADVRPAALCDLQALLGPAGQEARKARPLLCADLAR
eukprot:6906573-Alexandrium_andersonii.AAC.1